MEKEAARTIPVRPVPINDPRVRSRGGRTLEGRVATRGPRRYKAALLGGV